MNKSTKNKLERFAQFIEKLPEKVFNMTTWVNVGDEDCEVVELQNIEPCGTTCSV